MIIRKPYAFLIKNFRKIHIFLLLLCFYIFYINVGASSFIKEFMNLESYNPELEPISKYFNIFSYLALILIIVITFVIIRLLRMKKKPWKTYLIVVVSYFIMLFVHVYISSYFMNFLDNFKLAQVKLLSDVYFVVRLLQYPTFVLLIIRILGLDLKRFDFIHDEEFLELHSSDSEEVELNIEIDKYAIVRFIEKTKKEIQFFYLEHKFTVNILGSIILVFLIGYTYYYFGVLHKSYRQGSTLNSSGYAITVNKAYITDKDYKGETLDKNKCFVIIAMTVKNLSSPRIMSVDRFHLMNRGKDHIANNYYDTSFTDLGTPYNKINMQTNATNKFLLIYKVDKKLWYSKYVLYYQEYITSQKSYLRKMKIKLTDLSKIEKQPDKKLNEKDTFVLPNNTKEDVTFTNLDFATEFDYNYYSCDADDNCFIKTTKINITGKYKIMRLTFASTSTEGKDFVDFSAKYAKIRYVDGHNKTKYYKVISNIDRKYEGKFLYLKVPEELETSNKIDLIYTIRNKQYLYKLR